MKHLTISILLLSVLLFFTQCSKKIDDEDSEYIGVWQKSGKMILKIYETGEVYYKVYDNGSLIKSVEGMVKIKKGYLKMCQGTNCEEPSIDTEPTTRLNDDSSEETYMVIDGVELIKE